MKSSSMRWIIPAVVVAITALIIFQVNWLVREAEMKKEDEKRRIGEALRLTCIAMEKREARNFIGTSLDSVLIHGPLPEKHSVRTQVFHDSGQQIIVINDTNVRHREPWRIPTPPIPPVHMVDSLPSIPAPPPSPPHPGWVIEDSSGGTMVNAQVLVMQRKESMKSAMEDVMMEYVFNTDLPRAVDTNAFDSIFNSNLELQGITYPHTREIMPGPPDMRRITDSTTAKNEWEFQSKIYPGAPDPFAPGVVVTVDPGSGSDLLRILPQIVFSVLITAGMLILFLLIYREALKQKKIGEIRRDFINNMTHEFKTPLATMSLAADTIMNEKVIGDKEKVKYYAEQIKSENKKLNQQVEKVLELALTEKTGVIISKERLNLTEVVLRAMKSMELQVEAKGGTLVLETNPQIILIDADAFHLERVFVNLLDNALKYGGTPPRITVSIESFRSGTEIKITDNGKGIPSSDWKLIFEPFHRVSTGDVHNVKGFGLGLSYAKSVITEHNGTITVTKSNNSGTTFTVIIMHQ
jgi:signal transduction histidine kinase